MPTNINPFDYASRSLLRQAGQALLCWLLRVAPANLRFVRWIDTRMNVDGLPERVCDTIAHVQRLDQGGYPWAIPFEFQTEPDAQMFGRALVYEGMIWIQEKPVPEAGDRFDLVPVVVNLTGVGCSARRMAWLPGAETTLGLIEWNLETLDAEVILDQVERGEAPLALLAWMSLMKKGDESGTIERWLRVAGQEQDPLRRANLAIVVLFAQLTGCRDAWKKALEGFNVIESISVNEWKAEASVKTATKAIVTFLQARFGPIPAELKTKIEATTSLAVLDHWITLAGEAGSIEAFRHAASI